MIEVHDHDNLMREETKGWKTAHLSLLARKSVLISLSPARPVGPDLNHRAGARRAKAGAALKLP